MYENHPEFNLCTEGHICVYKTDMLNVQLYLQGVNFLPRLHTDWFKYKANQQSCVCVAFLTKSVMIRYSDI